MILPLALPLGFAFGGLAFVAHETLHGAVVRNRSWRYLIGYFSFLPFCISPRVWMTWHNRVHHAHTNQGEKDPDAYPRLKQYLEQTSVRIPVLWGALRSRKKRGLLTLLLGFSLQSLQVHLSAWSRGYLKLGAFLLALAEGALGWCIWGSFIYFGGGTAFLAFYLLPLMIANVIVMSYIVTNHSLSPLVNQNDPLQSSLTVKVPWLYEIYSLQFGYHVEHHIFPKMSAKYAPEVQAELRRIAGNDYQEMSLIRALSLVYRTPRVYRSNRELFDPETLESHPALGAVKNSLSSAEPHGFLRESVGGSGSFRSVRGLEHGETPR
ncbi:MAG: fatty acid desaturase [Polyangiaceae bacterium]|nr:fatty acid desaturase [Polyangiaceae bacterium]